MRNEMKKFGIKDQVGYLFGDLGGSMINLYISAYILTFCTYVLGTHDYLLRKSKSVV